jgi:hypothetical protein
MALCSVKESDPLRAVIFAALEAERRGGNLWRSKSASLVLIGRKTLKLDVRFSEDPVFEMLTKVRRFLLAPSSPLY